MGQDLKSLQLSTTEKWKIQLDSSNIKLHTGKVTEVEMYNIQYLSANMQTTMVSCDWLRYESINGRPSLGQVLHLQLPVALRRINSDTVSIAVVGSSSESSEKRYRNGQIQYNTFVNCKLSPNANLVITGSPAISRCHQ